jgi:uncharacterized protein (DUF58 family)
MYYRGVNRGLTFTKPGLYAFGLVLMIGMIAVTTGVNGLYVFLSAGLGGFIISGLLSEKAMKSSSVQSVGAAMVDAGAAFPMTFIVENNSSWFTVFALQNHFMLDAPKFRLISAPPDALASIKLASVAPAGQHGFSAMCKGLPRGRYERILAMQQTTFPFGILEKFKLIEVKSSLIIAPAIDYPFLDEVRLLVHRRLLARDADKEFYSHRAYAPRDALKDVDWKKSAARPPREWVVKQYRSPASVNEVGVDADWRHAAQLGSEALYEAFLSRVRTTVKALEETGRRFYVDFGGVRVGGRDEALAALAGAPRFEERRNGLGPAGAAPAEPVPGPMLVVRVDSLSWIDARERRAGRPA